MKLNDFLITVFNSYAENGDAISFGDTEFWEHQHYLWEAGYRGINLHDQTCKVMVENDGQE